jgi:PAS domain S-box-containing protein
LSVTHTKSARATDYQQLFEALPAQYIAVLPDDPVFTIAAENQEHAKVAMVEKQNILGKPLFEVFPDTSEKYRKTGVSDLAESFRKVIKTGKPDKMPTLRYDLKRPDGSIEERHWRLTHYPVFDNTGKLAIIYQNTEDITEEIKLEQQLQLTERQLEEALDIGMIGTWVWDLATDRVVANKNMAYMFNVSETDAAKGLPISSFTGGMHPDDRPDVQKAIAATIKSKGTFEYEYRTVSRDGSVHWVLARGGIEKSTDDRDIFPGVLIDITDRKQIENNLRYLARASEVLSSSLDYMKTLQATAQLMVPDIADWCAIEILGAPEKANFILIFQMNY